MSESKIRRKSKTYNFTMFTATASCDTIPMFDMAGGVVEMGTVSTNATQINLWVADTTNGPFYQLYDKEGSVVKITLAASTSAGRAYAMPDEVFGAHYIKFVSHTTNSTGTVGTVMFKG